MGIVSCYVMFLDCDNEEAHKLEPDINRFSHEEITGRSKVACLRTARKHGWKIGKKVTCPKCQNKEGEK